MGKDLRFVGCCHPKARDDANPEHRRGPQLTLRRMKAALQQMKGKRILDNHHPDRVVGIVEEAWMDGENQLWIRGRIDESSSIGKSAAGRIRNGTYAGLSLGMTHSVVKKSKPDYDGGLFYDDHRSQRRQKNHSSSGGNSNVDDDDDDDDWSNIHDVLSSNIEEVSVCAEGKFEHTILASFFSKNPAIIIPRGVQGKSVSGCYASRPGNFASHKAEETTPFKNQHPPLKSKGSQGNNNNYNSNNNINPVGDFKAALNSILSSKAQPWANQHQQPRVEQRTDKFFSIATFFQETTPLPQSTDRKNDEKNPVPAKMTSTMTTHASSAAALPSTAPMNGTAASSALANGGMPARPSPNTTATTTTAPNPFPKQQQQQQPTPQGQGAAPGMQAQNNGGEASTAGKTNMEQQLRQQLQDHMQQQQQQQHQSNGESATSEQQQQQQQEGTAEKGGAENDAAKNGDTSQTDLEDTPEIRLARLELERDRERREYEKMRTQNEAQLATQKQQLETLKEVARDMLGSDNQEALTKIVEQRRTEQMKEMYEKVLDLLPTIREQRNAAGSTSEREMLDQIVSNLEMFAQAKPEILKDQNKAHQVMQVVQLLGSQKSYADGLISKEKERAASAQQECDNLTNKLLTEQSRRNALEKELEITKKALDYMRQSADPDQLRQHEQMTSSLMSTMASKNAPANGTSLPTETATSNGAKPNSSGGTTTTKRTNNPLENLCSLIGQKRTNASANAPSMSAFGRSYASSSSGGQGTGRNVRPKLATPPTPASSSSYGNGSNATGASIPQQSSGMGYYTSPFDIRGITRMEGSGILAKQLRADGGNIGMTSDIASVFGNPLFDQYNDGSSGVGQIPGTYV